MTLSDWMDENGVSVADFADRIGVTRQAVHRYKSGERRPVNGELLGKIAKATGGSVTANDFYSADEDASGEQEEPESAESEAA